MGRDDLSEVLVMGLYWERDGEPGEMVECPSCEGWDVSETGVFCLACDGEGYVWRPLPDDDDLEEGG